MKNHTSTHFTVLTALTLGALTLAGCGASPSASVMEPSPPAQTAGTTAPTTTTAGLDAGSVAPVTVSTHSAMNMDGGPSGAHSAEQLSGAEGAAPSTEPSGRASAPKGVLRGTVTTASPKAAQNAIVYLTDVPTDRVVNATLLGKDMNFVPHVSVMTAGGTLTFVNGEPFPDTAFSPSNEKWDFGMVPVKASRSRKFEKAGIYTVLCRLHPNELGFLIVTPSGYFAKTDKNGSFTMTDVPQGKHTLAAWAPKMKAEERVIEVTGEQTVDFDLKR